LSLPDKNSPIARVFAIQIKGVLQKPFGFVSEPSRSVRYLQREVSNSTGPDLPRTYISKVDFGFGRGYIETMKKAGRRIGAG